MHDKQGLVIADIKNYNCPMTSGKIEKLLEAANSASDGDSSLNLAKRQFLTVAFYVIGLNENPNTAFTDGLIETARNAAVANIGYYSGLQKKVWKEFCSNFLKTDDEKEG